MGSKILSKISKLAQKFLFKRNPMSASDALRRHVDGTGSGWEIDDLISWSPTLDQENEAIKPLLEIHHRYRNAQYPIGINNPDSFEDIIRLAILLESKGL